MTSFSLLHGFLNGVICNDSNGWSFRIGGKLFIVYIEELLNKKSPSRMKKYL